MMAHRSSHNAFRVSDYESQHNTITTGLGGIVDGKFEYMGKDVTHTIGGSYTQTEALLLWILGRKPLKEETLLVDTLICLNIYPDPRIWSIRTGALAASVKAPLSACIAASHIAANGKIFGVGAVLNCSRFMKKIVTEVEREPLESVVEKMIKKKEFFPGFGRPLIQGPDERYGRLETLLGQWQYRKGLYTATLGALAPLLQQEKGLYPNFASLFTTLMIDPPFHCTDNQLIVLSHAMVAIPSAVTAAERHDLAGQPLLPLKIADIEYIGTHKRTLENCR